MFHITEYGNFRSNEGLHIAKRYLEREWWYHRDNEMIKRRILKQNRIFGAQYNKDGTIKYISQCEAFVNKHGLLSFTKTTRLSTKWN